MHYYHDDFGCLPPAFIPDEQGNPKHGWRVLILPYLEKTGFYGTEGLKRLYQSYDFSEAWDGPHNRKLAHVWGGNLIRPIGSRRKPLFERHL